MYNNTAPENTTRSRTKKQTNYSKMKVKVSEVGYQILEREVQEQTHRHIHNINDIHMYATTMQVE